MHLDARYAGNTTPRAGSWVRGVGNPTRMLLVFAAWVLSTQTIHAAGDVEDPERIRRAALSFAATLPMELPGRRVLDAARLDPRLRLPTCPSALDAEAAQGTRGGHQVTITVRCPVDPGWTLYVPIQLRYRLPVVVATMGMARGAVLKAGDVRLQETELSRVDQDLLLDPADAVGQQVRRPLAAGVPIRSAALEPVDVIRRGDRVIIDAETASFRVRMQGESLGDAATGERVRVRNLSSRRIVEGIATKKGTVRILR